jgi:catechol 2,3-dioxygenase-like lactoylglutathione lyase family enzyme
MATIVRNHYVLAVPDMEVTAAFFVGTLGFEETFRGGGGWIFVEKDGCKVMLGECPDAIAPQDLGDHSYFGYLVVDDVDAYCAEICAREPDLKLEPTDKPWGMREVGVHTPHGHRLQLGQSIQES